MGAVPAAGHAHDDRGDRLHRLFIGCGVRLGHRDSSEVSVAVSLLTTPLDGWMNGKRLPRHQHEPVNWSAILTHGPARDASLRATRDGLLRFLNQSGWSQDRRHPEVGRQLKSQAHANGYHVTEPVTPPGAGMPVQRRVRLVVTALNQLTDGNGTAAEGAVGSSDRPAHVGEQTNGDRLVLVGSFRGRVGDQAARFERHQIHA